jgi:hypothetical protein
MLKFVAKLWTEPSIAAFMLIVLFPPALLLWIAFAPKENRVPSASHEERGVAYLRSYIGGAPLGWWNISYPASLRMNDHKPVSVTYVPSSDGWRMGFTPDRLSVSIQGQGLDISPLPLNYDFNISQLLHAIISEAHIWTISPVTEGTHTIVFSFSVEPNVFSTEGSYRINDMTAKTVEISNELAREVEVYTILGIPISWDYGLNRLWFAVTSLLALPAIKMLLQHLLNRRKRASVKRARRSRTSRIVGGRIESAPAASTPAPVVNTSTQAVTAPASAEAETAQAPAPVLPDFPPPPR